MTHINRRSALAVVAAVPAAAAFGGVPTLANGGGELAALVRRYFAEVEVFNSTGFDAATGKYRSDRASNALAARTFDATMRQMEQTPVQTADDALALLDWMEKEDLIEPFFGDFEGMVEALVKSLRNYIASTGRVA